MAVAPVMPASRTSCTSKTSGVGVHAQTPQLAASGGRVRLRVRHWSGVAERRRWRVFTHALEACVSTDRSDFSTALAEKSIELVGVFLLRAYLDGNDTHARQKMHSASCLAGLAFNSASLGLNHGMAHQLGAKFHIPHGRANAMLLPHIIEFNSDINKHSKSQKEYLPAVKRYATVAQILGLSSYNEIMTVRSLVNWVQFMLKEMDIPLSISQMGTISEEEYFNAIDSMADAALEDGCTATNPRVPNKEDVIEIYKKLWK